MGAASCQTASMYAAWAATSLRRVQCCPMAGNGHRLTAGHRPNQQPNKDGINRCARRASEAADGSRGQAYAATALNGVVAELAAAPNGKRNETLNAVAFRMGKLTARGWIDEQTVTDALLGACDANKYLREHGHRATMKTIESGIEAGKKEPHPDLPDRDDPASGGDSTPASDLSDLS